MRTLATDRKAAPVAQATVATKVHQTLDIHRCFAPEIAFDLVIPIDQLADLHDLCVSQVLHTPFGRQPGGFPDLPCLRAADAKDICQGNLYAFIRGDIYPGDPSQTAISSQKQAAPGAVGGSDVP